MLVHKTNKSAACSFVLLVALLAPGAIPISAATIDFEGLPDSTIVTTQYSGLTFTNGITLTAGISLNEFEFPPQSGTNVVSDNGGIITIEFSTPVSSFSGYFTYLTTLTLTAFGPGSTPLGQAVSAFNSNLALSGDPGSGPNEFLVLNFPSGISIVAIAGDPAGGSFVLDDLTFAPVVGATPEPATFWPLLTGTVGLLFLTRKRI